MAELEATIEKVNGHQDADQSGVGLDGDVATKGMHFGSMPAFNWIWDSATREAVESQVNFPPLGRSTQSKSASEKGHAQKESANSQHRTTNTHANKTAKETASKQSSINYVPQAELDAELAKLQKLSHAAMTGDTTALDKLRAALDSCPHIWRRLADLQQLFEHKLIGLIGSGDPLRCEAFRKRCSDLRYHLSDADSSLATKMAASRVVSCWLFTQFLELRFLKSPLEGNGVKPLEQAERRYQSAMRTYAMARRLDLQLQA